MMLPEMMMREVAWGGSDDGDQAYDNGEDVRVIKMVMRLGDVWEVIYDDDDDREWVREMWAAGGWD